MSTHICEVTLFLLRQLRVISCLKPKSLYSYSQMQGHTMMFIRQNFGNSPSGWCEEGLRSKFSSGLYRLLGFAWIDGNTGLSAIDRLKMNACALSCEVMARGLDLWPQKRLWDVRGSGISRFLILKSVMLTFERLLIMQTHIRRLSILPCEKCMWQFAHTQLALTYNKHEVTAALEQVCVVLTWLVRVKSDAGRKVGGG